MPKSAIKEDARRRHGQATLATYICGSCATRQELRSFAA